MTTVPLGTRDVLRQVALYGVAGVVPAALSVAFTAVFTRVFPTDEFGRYSLVMSLAAALTALNTQWLQQAVVRYLPGATDPAEVRRLLGATAIGIVAVTGVGIVAGAAGLLIARPLLSPEWGGLVLPGVAALVGLSLFGTLSTVQQASIRPGRYTRYRVLESFARLTVALALVYGLTRRATSLVWAQAVSCALLIPALWRDSGLPGSREIGGSWRAWAATLVQFGQFGLPLTGYFLSAALLDAGDRYVIQLTRGAEEVGIYSANYGLVYGAASLAAAPVLMAAHPLLMRAWGVGDRTGAAEWLGRIAVCFGVIGVGLTAAVWLLAKDLAAVLLGSQFREGHVVMAPVFAGLLAWQLGMYTHKPLEFAGRTGVMFSAGLAMAAANVVLNLVFVPRYGYVAAAYTTLGCYAGYAALTFQIGRRYLPWRLDPKPILIAALTALPLAAGAVWLAHTMGSAFSDGSVLVFRGLAAVALGLGIPALILRRLGPTPRLVSGSESESKREYSFPHGPGHEL